MTRWMLVVMVLGGCKGKDGENAEEDAAAPRPCVIGADVCMVFDGGWTSSDAADECAERGGERSPCPADSIGDCSADDDGVVYRMYDLNPVDAASYCEYLGGVWAPND